MRNRSCPSESCTSFHPGHRTNPRAIKSLAARPTLWAPADVEVMASPVQGLTLHVFAGGTHHQVFAHDLSVIVRLLRMAPARPEGVSLGRVNFHNNALALPADPRHSAGLAYFSFSTEPLAPCLFERDEALARDFDALTAELQRS